jgi:hypothetical protein
VANGSIPSQLVDLLEPEVRHLRQFVLWQAKRLREEAEDESVRDFGFCVHEQVRGALDDVQTRAAGCCEGGVAGRCVSGRAAGCGERAAEPSCEGGLPLVKLACHSSAADTGEICK